MNWVEKELVTAMGVGTAAGIAVGNALAGGWSVSGALVFGFLGAIVGAIVGAFATFGGAYALRTAQVWPPASVRRWKHRFAVCSTLSTAVLVVGFFVVVTASTDSITRSNGDPDSIAPVAVILGATYVLAYILCPPKR